MEIPRNAGEESEADERHQKLLFAAKALVQGLDANAPPMPSTKPASSTSAMLSAGRGELGLDGTAACVSTLELGSEAVRNVSSDARR